MLLMPTKLQSHSNQHQNLPWVSKVAPYVLWLFFFSSIALIVLFLLQQPNWRLGNYLRINGLSLAIFATVGFFGAVISKYAKNYLNGFTYQQQFSWYSLGFIVSVLLFVVANHVGILVGSWFFMGLFMAKLIGVNTDWLEAKASSNYALRFYLASSLFLAISLGMLVYYTDSWYLNIIFQGLSTLTFPVLLASSLLLILSGLIQSALFPFHRWLLSAMTAPTPASALMHAGFINGAGILFTLFASLLIASNTLTLLFIIGGFTAIIAQFVKLLQVNVKHKLACSTIAQMGFMVMQCGLGFFNAAIAHLILHGFYKAYLFLSSGEEIEMSYPEKPKKLQIRGLQTLFVVVFGLAGAALFMLLTGKHTLSNTSIFLTLVVAITVGQATYNLMKEKSYSYVQRIILSVLFFTIGVVLYALFYNGVSVLLAELRYVKSPIQLTYIEIGFGLLFLVGFFMMKLGIFKSTPWLYVKLLNLTQPNKNTILKYKS